MKQKHRRRLIIGLVALLAVLGVASVIRAYATQPLDTTDQTYDLVFEAQPGPDVPDLHTLTSGATSDAEIVGLAVDYFEAHKTELAQLWRIDHADRLKAVYAMYITHISTPYGEIPNYPANLNEYLDQERAHCGTYTYAQMQIAAGLGLHYRSIEFVAEHAWLEVRIDGAWELFDATTNTWINRPIEALLNAEPRQYRWFYTPLLDQNRPDARLHLAEGYNMQRLRLRMPTLGIAYFPPGEMRIIEAAE